METGLKLQQLFPGILLASTVCALVASPAFAQVVQVTGVRVTATPSTVEVILETDSKTLPQVLTASYGKTFVANIISTQLRLPDRQAFRQENPAQGIASVTVTQQNANTIRVAVTGTNKVPTVKASPGPSGLVFSLGVPPTTTPTPSTETPAAAEAEPKPPAAPQPEVTPTPEAQPETPTATPEPEEEIDILVTGEQDRYLVPDASTATRTDTPLRDIPQSIQVIPKEVLEDQQVTRIQDALDNFSGVTSGSTFGNATLEYNIRGFNNVPILRDGFREFGTFQGIPETTHLERIEVLRGPASILYGEIQPGGVINLVSKKPLDEPFYQAELQLGNRGLIRPQIDFSGPLTSDNRLLYRLNALYLNDDGFVNFDQDLERFFVAPVVSWQINERTDLTLQLEYTNEEAPAEAGLPVVGDSIADVPLDLNIAEPDDVVDTEFINVGYNLEHRFSDNWRLRNAFRYTNRDLDNLGVLAFEFDEVTGLLTRYPLQRQVDVANYSLQTNIVGEFAIGSIENTLLAGVDLQREEFQEINRIDFSAPQPLNIFDPVYGLVPDTDPDDLPLDYDADREADRLGIYLQDQIKFSDNVILLAGLRYDTVEQRTTTNPTDSDPLGSETTQNNDAVTPRVGIVYQPIPEISLYGSYSQSFTPSSDRTSEGQPLEPERGEGFEFGVKTELLEGRLVATLAYFDITRQNVATPDPNDQFASVATGEQQSRGVEFDVTGEILPGWNVIVSYAYIDAEVTEDTDRTRIGNRLYNTPEHSASFWTTYEIQQGDLQGLGFGIGFKFVGEREGDLDNSFELDSYFLTNAGIFYRRDNWRLALNFRNLFDIDYIEANRNDRVIGNEPGLPLTVIGSVSVEF